MRNSQNWKNFILATELSVSLKLEGCRRHQQLKIHKNVAIQRILINGFLELEATIAGPRHNSIYNAKLSYAGDIFAFLHTDMKKKRKLIGEW